MRDPHDNFTFMALSKKLMNSSAKFILLSIFSFLLFLTSCNDEDSGPSFEFKDQNLQGIIDGIPFEFGEGTVESTFLNEGQLSFDLLDQEEQYDNVCDISFGDEVRVFFDAPNEVGVYELFFDLSSFNRRVVTLLNPNGEDGIPQNNIASSGAVEIITITDTQVTGRIDATLDGDNTVNGNFTAVFCKSD